ncbi:MutS protein msh5 [Irineochytrium annulatum]|nr:MutS protein msh5 [Irineochytrium annulatum]
MAEEELMIVDSAFDGSATVPADATPKKRPRKLISNSDSEVEEEEQEILRHAAQRAATSPSSRSRPWTGKAKSSRSKSDLTRPSPRASSHSSALESEREGLHEEDERPALKAMKDMDGEEDEEDEVFGDKQFILCLSLGKGYIGAAHFAVDSSTLYLHEDVPEERGLFEVTRLLIYQVQPSVVVLSSRADEDYANFVKACSIDASIVPIAPSIVIRPSTEFIYKNARARLLSNQLLEKGEARVEVEGGADISEKTTMALYIESIVSLESVNMVIKLDGILANEEARQVGAAGSLIAYVSQARLIGEIKSEANDLEIRAVEQFNLYDGPSVFGMLNMTKTPIGSSLLRNWFLRPTLDMTVLKFRHDSIAALLKAENQGRVAEIRACLANIKNVPRIIMRLKRNVSVLEWQALLKIRAAVEDSKGVPIFDKIKELLPPRELREVGSYINNVIDFDESIAENRFVVKPDVDGDLDEQKRTYEGLDDLLVCREYARRGLIVTKSHAAREIAKSIPSEFSRSLNVIYFPQLGFLITIPLRDDMTEQEDFMIPGFNFQFCTSKTMDQTIGDIHSMIVDREIEIMQKLRETVLSYTETITSVVALAEAAHRFKYVRPTMVCDDSLEIVGGRHPLVELTSDTFISNPTKFLAGNAPSDDNDELAKMRILLLTGPNSCGKSVGLIVYLAHVGSFVPADKANIGLTDKILTRVQTLESVSKIQSTFMIDTQQVSIALRSATSRSLILIGIHVYAVPDGVGLFCAVLESLTERGDECPKTIATTHFHELFSFNLLEPSPYIGCFTMDFIRADDEEEAQGSGPVTFLYRIKAGRAGTSLGIYCAKLAGIPPHVLERGRIVSDCLVKGDAIPPVVTPRQAERDLACSRALDFFLDFDCENGEIEELWQTLRLVEAIM